MHRLGTIAEARRRRRSRDARRCRRRDDGSGRGRAALPTRGGRTHADLPFVAEPRAARHATAPARIVAIVPCHRDDGNRRALGPRDVPLRGSPTARARSASHRRGPAARLERPTSSATPELAFDVDVPDDLAIGSLVACADHDLPTPAARSRSEPIPTTSSSAAARRSPSGRDAGTRSACSCCTDGSKGTWDPDADRRRWSPTAGTSSEPPPPSSAPPVSHFLGGVDGELGSDGCAERSYGLRGNPRARPDVVLGHDPWKRYRLHPDHRHAGWLRARRDRRGPRSALLPRAAPRRRTAPERILLFEAEEVDHLESVDRLDRPPRWPGPAVPPQPVAFHDADRRLRPRRRRQLEGFAGRVGTRPEAAGRTTPDRARRRVQAPRSGVTSRRRPVRTKGARRCPLLTFAEAVELAAVIGGPPLRRTPLLPSSSPEPCDDDA